MKVLVTGGSGFIGTRLVRLLLDKGHDVAIFDKVTSTAFPQLSGVGDVCDLDALQTATKGCNVVVHLAAEHRDDVNPVAKYYDVNVGGAVNLIQACTFNEVARIVFTSTVAIYGLDVGEPTEAYPTRPFNDYGKSKLGAESVFNQWVLGDRNRSLVIIRPAVVFGEGNRGNVYNLITQIASGRFVMVGDGRNKKSMAYVGNVAAFLCSAAESAAPGVEAFNYADKPDFLMNELVRQVEDHAGIRRTLPIRIPYWLGILGGTILDRVSSLTGKRFPISAVRVRKFCASTTISVGKLQASGFQPPFSLSEGMSRFLEHELPRG